MCNACSALSSGCITSCVSAWMHIFVLSLIEKVAVFLGCYGTQVPTRQCGHTLVISKTQRHNVIPRIHPNFPPEKRWKYAICDSSLTSAEVRFVMSLVKSLAALFYVIYSLLSLCEHHTISSTECAADKHNLLGKQ